MRFWISKTLAGGSKAKRHFRSKVMAAIAAVWGTRPSGFGAASVQLAGGRTGRLARMRRQRNGLDFWLVSFEARCSIQLSYGRVPLTPLL